MIEKTALIWFRQDLRLTDNTALLHAVHNGYSIIPVFILDDESPAEWKRGAASRWWLHGSLQALNISLDNHMIFRSGHAGTVIPQLAEETGARAVFWNRCYEPWRINRDSDIKAELKKADISCETFNSSLLWEPWDIKKNDGTPYKVFTPYYRRGCLSAPPPPEPQERPDNIAYATFSGRGDVHDLNLLPSIEWYENMERTWQPGEDAARKRMHDFIENGLAGYKEGRNRPDRDNVSRLSPYLHFGEISPREVWHTARTKGMDCAPEADVEHFCSELGWREFSYSLLYYNRDIMRKPLQPRFKNFPWDNDAAAIERWQKGKTGIPIVDAGMRELWQTGWMHNRVRMIVASLLIKNCLTHWHKGEDWFWDTLVDADLANNSASWQWVAGCGADAAPFFRIFNPVTQGQKFDPDGVYIRKYVPELSKLPTKNIFAPWEAKPDILRHAGVTLGKEYPKPIVDLKQSRERALNAFKSLK